MPLLTIGELQGLVERREGPCVSIYMPAVKTGREVQQNPIRLKNLLRSAEEQLAKAGMRPTEARDMLSPAADLLEERVFWQRQGDGLALFVGPRFFRHYGLTVSFDELVVVTHRFHTKPLVSLLASDGEFYVMALSQNQVRLLECTRFSVTKLDLEGTPIPTSMAEALWADDPEKQRQFHTFTPSGGAPAGGSRGEAIYHGHSVTDEMKDNLRRYFLQIDRGLNELLNGSQAPVVLACVDYLQPIYEGVNTYPNLVTQGVDGNPDGVRAEDIQKQAWTIIEPYFRRSRDDAAARYRSAIGTGLASRDVSEIALAAGYGRVDSLFVVVGAQVWGAVDLTGNRVEVHEEAQIGDEDLLDFAAIQALLNKGKVFAVPQQEMPDDHKAAAVFRY